MKNIISNIQSAAKKGYEKCKTPAAYAGLGALAAASVAAPVYQMGRLGQGHKLVDRNLTLAMVACNTAFVVGASVAILMLRSSNEEKIQKIVNETVDAAIKAKLQEIFAMSQAGVAAALAADPEVSETLRHLHDNERPEPKETLYEMPEPAAV